MDQEVVEVWEDVEQEPVKTTLEIRPHWPVVLVVVAVAGAVMDWEEEKTAAV